MHAFILTMAYVTYIPYTDNFHNLVNIFIATVADPFEVRITGGRVPWEGRVEVRVNDKWGRVCGKDWSSNHYAVLCRELGYAGLIGK